MNIFTIDTYQKNVKHINEKEIDYLIKLKYPEDIIIINFGEHVHLFEINPLFENKYFCSKINWFSIIAIRRESLSFNFIRKHKKYALSQRNSYFHHFTEEFLDEMWDEFKYKENLITTLGSTENLSIKFIEKRFESIIEKNTFEKKFYEDCLWDYIYNNLKDKNIDTWHHLLKKILKEYKQNNNELQRIPLTLPYYLRLKNKI